MTLPGYLVVYAPQKSSMFFCGVYVWSARATLVTAGLPTDLLPVFRVRHGHSGVSGLVGVRHACSVSQQRASLDSPSDKRRTDGE